MKRRCIVLFLVLSIFVSIIFYERIYNKYIVEEKNVSKNIVNNNNFLSMMLEQNSGVGDYELSTLNDFPTDGYIFNDLLSKCENGSELSWDDEKKKVVLKGNVSDKCYVYFDKVVTSIADVCSNNDKLSSCIISFYNLGVNTNIYYHDFKLPNGAGDNSYRYAGSSDSVNNYVCFGSELATCPVDNLYRIIGVFDDKVKLIKNTSVGKYSWNTNGYIWSSCTLNKGLNGSFYYNNLEAKFQNMISITDWKTSSISSGQLTASAMYNDEILNSTSSSSGKIGLMYISDYGFSASPSAWGFTIYDYKGNNSNGIKISTNNWLFFGSYEWTMVFSSWQFSGILQITPEGSISNGNGINKSYDSRPAFYLNSDIKYVSGFGTKNNPILIN